MKIDFDKIYPQMKKLATDTIKATYMQIDPNNNQYTFELFGYDFMVDENQKVWLIEVNTNPCLELSSSLLSRMIPALVENVVKVAIDPVFPAPEWSNSRKGQIPDFSENKFELVFNESKDGDELKEILKQANLKDIIREEYNKVFKDELLESISILKLKSSGSYPSTVSRRTVGNPKGWNNPTQC